jgi:hypothetical protein
MLKVVLNVAEDEELRKYIKSMIDGQVRSIVREHMQTDVRQIIA